MPEGAAVSNLRPPFAAGNTAAVTNGARVAAWRLEGRAREIAETIRPDLRESDAGAEIMLMELAETLARLEIARAWLAEHGLFQSEKTGAPWPILTFVGAWETKATRLVKLLGLGPAKGKGNASADDPLAAYLATRDEEASS